MKDILKLYLFLFFIAVTIFSCNQQVKKKLPTETRRVAQIVESNTIFQMQNENIYTRDSYLNSNGHPIIIENSYPRGGLKYKSPAGDEFTYAVFWTRIMNKTDSNIKIDMTFDKKEYQLPSQQDRYFKLFLPSDTLTYKKEPKFNYGLDLEGYLNNHFYAEAKLERVIPMYQMTGFYVIVLFDKGVKGTLRTKFTMLNDSLVYQVNDKKIGVGRISSETNKVIN